MLPIRGHEGTMMKGLPEVPVEKERTVDGSVMSDENSQDVVVRRRKLVLGCLLAMAAVSSRAATRMVNTKGITVDVTPRGPVEVNIEVSGEPANRLTFSTLRSTARLASITLKDPSGQVVWQKLPAEVGFVDRERTGQPHLGDAMTGLPEVRDAKRGTWTLVLDPLRTVDAGGKSSVAYGVVPRFELVVLPARAMALAGDSIPFTVMAFDYGKPLAGLTGLNVVARTEAGGVVGTAAALESAKNREGVVLPQEQGAYVAVLKLEDSGRYRIEASHTFSGAAGPQVKVAQTEVAVGAREAALELVSMKPRQGRSGCAGEYILEFGVTAAVPGDYVCSVTLQAGDVRIPRASTSIALEQGKGRIGVAVTQDMLSRITLPWPRISKAVLLRRTSNEMRVVAELNDIDLSKYGVDASKICR